MCCIEVSTRVLHLNAFLHLLELAGCPALGLFIRATLMVINNVIAAQDVMIRCVIRWIINLVLIVIKLLQLLRMVGAAAEFSLLLGS